jgi:replicative DNA helicase
MMGEEDWRRVAQRMGEIADAPLWLFHSANPDLTSLEDETKALSDAYGLRLIAIDNVDALMNGNTGPEETLYRLKQLAADLGVPILVTATMKTHADARTHGRPDMNDLTNSDPIGAIVDILILLDRPDAYDVESSRAGEIDLIFAKNRYGPIATATLAFQGYYCRMLDLFVSSDPGRDWSFKGLKSTAANPPKKDDS